MGQKYPLDSLKTQIKYARRYPGDNAAAIGGTGVKARELLYDVRRLHRKTHRIAVCAMHVPTARAVLGARLALCAAILVPGLAPAAADTAAHAIAMRGAPATREGIAALPYVNPEAPKGGRLVQGVLGTFDSLNPLIVKGIAVQAIRGYVIESLMARSYDEPFTLYGLLARTVETDDARDYVTFRLDPAAHFSDGVPVTADDVVFSWQLLRDHGRPNYHAYYSKVAKAEILGPRSVRFDLAGSHDRELPLILGLMPVLPKHAIDVAAFENTTLAKPIGSGPYVVAAVDPGRSVTLKRDPNYWGRSLAINRGEWNFDELRFDYYRDANAYFEAFKAGLYDMRSETDPSRWQTGYDFPAVRDGRVVKESFPDGLPKPASAFVFNTRRPVFSDIRVREAMARLFDAEWVNRNFFFGLYKRSAGFFDNSELSAYRRPASAREHALLAPFPHAVRPDVLAGTWSPPISDGSGRDRASLRQALALLGAAGYQYSGPALRRRSSRRPLRFEIMVKSRDEERLALAFADNLARAGILAQVRLVDAVQYDQRLLSFDFDMIENRWDESLSPGNEQSFYWGSAAAAEEGSRNYMGVRSAAADAAIAAMLRARDRADFVAAVRALDRVLISGCYVVPLFYLPRQWVARWISIEHPARTSLFGYLPETWWHQPQRAQQ